MQYDVKYGRVINCDILSFPCSLLYIEGQRPKGGRRRMNKYELAVVVSAKLEEEERAAVIAKISEYITRFGGNVLNVDDWGKRKLAYEIQKMKEAFYYFVQFESDANCPNEVENNVRIMEPVIRYLCVKQEA